MRGGAPRTVAALVSIGLAYLAAIVEPMTSLLDHSFVVRTTAAIALAYRLGQDLPDEALTILIDAKAGEALPDFPLSWHERAQRGYVALALQR